MDCEEEIIRAVQNGDTNAFRSIVEKYQSFVMAICLNITRDKYEAENLAQETFIQVYRSLKNYQFKGFKTWIGRIATNKCIDYKRKMKRQTSHEVYYIDEVEYVPDERVSVQDNLIDKEDREKIKIFCDKLPEKYSGIIKKYYLYDESCKTIADEENISTRTVESRLYRAKKMLKAMWEEDENEPL